MIQDNNGNQGSNLLSCTARPHDDPEVKLLTGFTAMDYYRTQLLIKRNRTNPMVLIPEVACHRWVW